jgi:hypothetical protein
MDLGRLIELLRSLRLDTNNMSMIASVLGRVGARGVVAMARAYLGPAAYEVEARWCRERNMTPCERVGVPDQPEEPPDREEPAETGTGTGNENVPPVIGTPPPSLPPAITATLAGLDGAEIAILGMAINKLIYEAGELALHNPTVASEGRHPDFKLDTHGCPPAISLSHIIAATRVLRGPSTEAEVPMTPATRQRMQQARAERYSNIRRFTLPDTSNTRLR